MGREDELLLEEGEGMGSKIGLSSWLYRYILVSGIVDE